MTAIIAAISLYAIYRFGFDRSNRSIHPEPLQQRFISRKEYRAAASKYR